MQARKVISRLLPHEVVQDTGVISNNNVRKEPVCYSSTARKEAANNVTVTGWLEHMYAGLGIHIL
jgi:hypothetical protein